MLPPTSVWGPEQQAQADAADRYMAWVSEQNRLRREAAEPSVLQQLSGLLWSDTAPQGFSGDNPIQPTVTPVESEAEELLDRGIALMQRGDARGAREALRESLRLYPLQITQEWLETAEDRLRPTPAATPAREGGKTYQKLVKIIKTFFYFVYGPYHGQGKKVCN